MDQYVLLAKQAVEKYILEGKIITPTKDLPRGKAGLPKNFFSQKSGIFVTIEKNGELRGCIGTFLATKENIAKEIISNAIASATEDYRFETIQKEELPQLSYIVSVINEPKQIKDIKELNPKRFGIIIKTETSKSGLLLPDLEGVNTVEDQISITCRKGGINPKEEDIIIYKFTTEKHA